MPEESPINFEQLQAKQIAECRRSFAELVDWYAEEVKNHPKKIDKLLELVQPGKEPMLWFSRPEEIRAVSALARISLRAVSALYVQREQDNAARAREAGG